MGRIGDSEIWRNISACQPGAANMYVGASKRAHEKEDFLKVQANTQQFGPMDYQNFIFGIQPHEIVYVEADIKTMGLQHGLRFDGFDNDDVFLGEKNLSNIALDLNTAIRIPKIKQGNFYIHSGLSYWHKGGMAEEGYDQNEVAFTMGLSYLDWLQGTKAGKKIGVLSSEFYVKDIPSGTPGSLGMLKVGGNLSWAKPLKNAVFTPEISTGGYWSLSKDSYYENKFKLSFFKMPGSRFNLDLIVGNSILFGEEKPQAAMFFGTTAEIKLGKKTNGLFMDSPLDLTFSYFAKPTIYSHEGSAGKGEFSHSFGAGITIRSPNVLKNYSKGIREYKAKCRIAKVQGEVEKADLPKFKEYEKQLAEIFLDTKKDFLVFKKEITLADIKKALPDKKAKGLLVKIEKAYEIYKNQRREVEQKPLLPIEKTYSAVPVREPAQPEDAFLKALENDSE